MWTKDYQGGKGIKAFFQMFALFKLYNYFIQNFEKNENEKESFIFDFECKTCKKIE